MVKVVECRGDEALARVYVLELADGALVECAESVQPPVPREEKWVLIVSTLRGCPFRCLICDAGGSYRGPLSAEEILEQVLFLVGQRHPDGRVGVPKLKVQFARMGEPALNDGVLEALQALPGRLDAPGLMPCLSTIAPWGRDRFFEELIEVKEALYPGGRFQMQFSIHATDEEARRRLVPARTWSFRQIAAWGERFHAPGDRKVTLNLAPVRGIPLEPLRLAEVFSPERFFVKLTPVNPTFAARRSNLDGLLDPRRREECEAVADGFRRAGFEALVSIGETAENEIGSNCGMLVQARRPTG